MMPNHVTNKIVFSADKADEVFKSVCPNGKFDFEILVPSPPHLYQGGLSGEDEKDFPLNWLSWNRENWGTKWNCYDQSCGIEDGKAFIKFDTAWSAPYPIMAAFCNKFNIPFEHRYFDEGENFWGIDTWGEKAYSPGHVERMNKAYNRPEDRQRLALELKGRSPDAEDDDDGR
jgi:Ferredoxin-like domain in Api92-like protein